MAQITQAGALNTAALVVPDLYVQIASPQSLSLNGVPTNLAGFVGTSSWGPVNQPVVFGSMAGYSAAFGPVMPRGFDMGTLASCAVQQGASAMVGVRVTDGTDTAANYAISFDSSTNSYPILLTALYTGSQGNNISLALAAGSKSGTWKLILQLPGNLAEVFDNISASAGNPGFWQNLVQAVNTGIGPLRGPSALCVASLGTETTVAPSAISNQTLMGGTDGIQNVTAATLVGSDGLVRTGMYALRGQGCAVGALADCSDATQWPAVSSFALSEGIYMVVTGPSGDTISSAVQTKENAGIDSYGVKVMFGDWLYWYDQVNSQTRLVSPLGFTVGCLANLSPEQSSLNKALRTPFKTTLAERAGK